MMESSARFNKPHIVVSDVDHRRLTEMADAATGPFADVGETLHAEMERAEIVAANSVPMDVVQMGSTVEFRSETGERRTLTLVFPGDADIAANRISILTPVGVALIGLKVGQSIQWAARDGSSHELTVERVS